MLYRLCASAKRRLCRDMLQFCKLSRSMSFSKYDQDEDVLFSQINTTGVIKLNRPKALNSLNLSMVRRMFPIMLKWEEKNSFVSQVIIVGSGEKAFCAGGDVVDLTTDYQSGGTQYKDFFREEYHLNKKIAIYKLPYIAIIDGITMGGGVGLSIHGMYRVATERTLFAMPETAIGLFPDVGSSYPLSRLPGHLGTYLTLTGHRLKGRDLYHSKIATHFVKSDLIHDLIDELEEVRGSHVENTNKILNKYHEQSLTTSTEEYSLAPHIQDISDVFHHESMEDVLSALETHNTEWSRKTSTLMQSMSPISMVITLKLMQSARYIPSLADIFRLDYRLARKCMESGDFVEGVRSKLVDKDNSPKWKFSSVTDVTPDVIEHFFCPLPEEEEWNLPPESKKKVFEHRDL